ncbi:stalk domain-containing protein [Paenibacillus sp. 1A_MP2]|uniref:stalk domain-containing protein n=1 Tax=Paenibacillus sp. 1A_MP2 TaxID=3457495 RepID=UPI003FCCB12F
MKKFAHKVAYIAGGIIIGVVFSTSAGAFADTVKSMVGKKVTGEYTIVVDGKKLSDKGAVIDSRANVPARALSEALGADVSVSGKTISITSTSDGNTIVDSTPSSPSTETNKYIGQSKSSLEEQKKVIEDRILTPTRVGREQAVQGLEEAKKTGDAAIIKLAENKLAEYDAEISKYEADLKLVNEALAAIK